MGRTAPIAVIIPTYKRGMAVLSVLERVALCDPKPTEVWVHVDLADGLLERELNQSFPEVRVLLSQTRVGPGGGRHRCLLSCNTPYAVSFDDDSYPVDADFFARVEQLFSQHPKAAIFGASIWHRHEPTKGRNKMLVRVPNYVGCGHAIRLAAYRQVRGYLPLPRAYGMEESDLSLQLFAAGWQIYASGELRVFHDTDLNHHQSADVTAAVIANVGLYAFLNYPINAWGWGILQLANKVAYCIRRGRLRGVCTGLLSIPRNCYCNRKYRKPVTRQTLRKFLH